MDVTSESFEREVLERSRRAAGRGRLLGRLVRALPDARPRARARGRIATGRVRARQGRRRRQPGACAPLRDPGHPGREGLPRRRGGARVRRRAGRRRRSRQFLDELTGPTATEKLVAELQTSGELPEVVAGARTGRATNRHSSCCSRQSAPRRATVAGASDHPDRRPVRRARPRAPADDALPAAARRHPLLMAATSSVTCAKEFHFPVRVEWLGERRVAARVEGKPAIEITAPPVFRGTDPTTWSPEDFFVAAAASCLAVTFTGLAARAGLAYTSLSIEGDGVAGKRADGRFGFTRLSLRLAVETDRSRRAAGAPARRAGRADLPRLRLARPPDRDRDRGQPAVGAVSARPALHSTLLCRLRPRAGAARAGRDHLRGDRPQPRPRALLPARGAHRRSERAAARARRPPDRRLRRTRRARTKRRPAQAGDGRIGSGATVTQPTPLDTKLAASGDEREAAFARAHPRYADTAILDELRRSDFARLDAGGHVYLDYTGAGLYADSQLERAHRAAASGRVRQSALASTRPRPR